ncbi:hypothetical protein SHK09_02275 [Polaribacter sp. PL03]|uniref:hypothetical protein n=1 Tax=Polaribacter sp. PL03 TaxID=3088353 RepID=UPI0029CF2D40|nr:hypothetical protein [Polaribacter sp. PL03]MDX6745605.1 hypothetical protein [Polaribacter sp. PL03]
MKPYIYNITFFFFFIAFNLTSQTKENIIKKSFKVDENTILNLDLDNVAIVFEESFDGEIHFDYSIIFGRYSKRKREIIINQSKTKVSKKNNLVSLKVGNSEFLGINLTYMLDFNSKDYLTSFKDYVKYEKARKHIYKSKDSVLKELASSEGNNLTNFMKRNKENYKDYSSIKDKKVMIKKFVIKVPKNLKIRIKAIKTDITFNYDLVKPFTINSFKGVFRFKNIIGKENRIISSNGIFQAEKVTNSRLEFLDMSKVLIGEISNTDLVTETSKLETGEIGKNVSINDFNSKLYLYNFSQNFSKFNLTGDYSELNFYKLEDNNFSMDVFGHNTVLNMNDTKTTFGLSKDKKLDKILEKKAKESKTSSGTIAIELRNGILNIK